MPRSTYPLAVPPRVVSRFEALFQPVTQHQQFIDLGNAAPLSGEGREGEDGVISKSPGGMSDYASLIRPTDSTTAR